MHSAAHTKNTLALLDTDSFLYMMLANYLLHKFYPDVVTIAEVITLLNWDLYPSIKLVRSSISVRICVL